MRRWPFELDLSSCCVAIAVRMVSEGRRAGKEERAENEHYVAHVISPGFFRLKAEATAPRLLRLPEGCDRPPRRTYLSSRGRSMNHTADRSPLSAVRPYLLERHALLDHVLHPVADDVNHVAA